MCDLVFFFVMLVFFSVMLVIGCALRIPKQKCPKEKHNRHKNECSPPAWGGRLAAALAMIFENLRTCKGDDNLLLREACDWSYGAVRW